MGEGSDHVRERLTAAVGGAGRGVAIAERLCTACVDVLEVDGAGLWWVTGRAAGRSLSTCGVVTAELDQLQLAGGEGPCWDAVRFSTLVTASDVAGADSDRWPAFTAAAGEGGVRTVYAVPVSVVGVPTGVLYLCRSRLGRLTGPVLAGAVLAGALLAGALLAGELAVLPLLDVIADARALQVGAPAPITQRDFGWLTRAEVYQSVGMVCAQLGIHPAEALLLLRGYAFANDLTASQVAFSIIERRLPLEDDRTGTQGRHEPGDWPEPGGWPEAGGGCVMMPDARERDIIDSFTSLTDRVGLDRGGQLGVPLDRDELMAAVQAAIARRAVVETAKGVLAQVHGITMSEAFTAFRAGARHRDMHLADFAREVVADAPSAAGSCSWGQSRHRPWCGRGAPVSSAGPWQPERSVEWRCGDRPPVRLDGKPMC